MKRSRERARPSAGSASEARRRRRRFSPPRDRSGPAAPWTKSGSLRSPRVSRTPRPPARRARNGTRPCGVGRVMVSGGGRNERGVGVARRTGEKEQASIVKKRSRFLIRRLSRVTGRARSLRDLAGVCESGVRRTLCCICPWCSRSTRPRSSASAESRRRAGRLCEKRHPSPRRQLPRVKSKHMSSLCSRDFIVLGLPRGEQGAW